MYPSSQLSQQKTPKINTFPENFESIVASWPLRKRKLFTCFQNSNRVWRKKYFSYTWLAARCGYEERQVRRICKEWREAGYIDWEYRYKTTNIWWVKGGVLHPDIKMMLAKYLYPLLLPITLLASSYHTNVESTWEYQRNVRLDIIDKSLSYNYSHSPSEIGEMLERLTPPKRRRLRYKLAKSEARGIVMKLKAHERSYILNKQYNPDIKRALKNPTLYQLIVTEVAQQAKDFLGLSERELIKCAAFMDVDLTFALEKVRKSIYAGADLGDPKAVFFWNAASSARVNNRIVEWGWYAAMCRIFEVEPFPKDLFAPHPKKEKSSAKKERKVSFVPKRDNFEARDRKLDAVFQRRAEILRKSNQAPVPGASRFLNILEK